MNISIQNDWQSVIESEQNKPYFTDIQENLDKETTDKQIVYPNSKDIFKAFELCSLQNTKVVILGQDPYHNSNQAMGLSFSVPKTQTIPPSLKNIFKELSQDIPTFTIPNHGDLTPWAQQGVLLLNASLTVRKNEPNSHKKLGWHRFTDSIIQHISNQKESVVFLLWGAFAQSKKELINTDKHLILTAPHPSPFSAYKGFFGCQHFSKTNVFLEKTNQEKINWTILD